MTRKPPYEGNKSNKSAKSTAISECCVRALRGSWALHWKAASFMHHFTLTPPNKTANELWSKGLPLRRRKGKAARQLTRCLCSHSFSLRTRIAYADAYAGLRTSGFCFHKVTRSLLPLLRVRTLDFKWANKLLSSVTLLPSTRV